MKFQALAALAATCVVSLTACGGSSASALSKADWETKGNAICKDVNDKVEALGQPTSMAELGTFLGKLVPIVTDGADRLAALKPPAEYASSAATFIANTRTEIDAAKAAAAKASAGDTAGAVQAISKLDDNKAADDAAAKSAGLPECAK